MKYLFSIVSYAPQLRLSLASGSILVAMFAALEFASASEITFIDFEDIGVPTGGNIIAGDRTSTGFRFDSSTDHIHMINGFNEANNGTTNLAVDDSAGRNILTVSRIDGSIFSLDSLEIGEWSGVLLDHATSVTVIGRQSTGSTITKSIAMDGIADGTGPLADFQIESFSGWASLVAFSMQGFGGFRGGAFAIDNLKVQGVPEPTTIILAATVAMTTLIRRRPPSHNRV